MNGVTSFVDASNVYGSMPKRRIGPNKDTSTRHLRFVVQNVPL